MTMKPLEPFEFGVLRDEGIRVTLLGGFIKGQFLSAEYDGVQWNRRQMESAEQMEKRVCKDIRKLMGVDRQLAFAESGAA